MNRKTLYHILGYAGLALLMASSAAYCAGLFINMLWVVQLIGAVCIIICFFGNIGKIRDYLLKRSTRYRANTIFLIFLFLGVLVLVQAISDRHHRRYDLTSTKRYTLSKHSLTVLKKVDLPIHVTAFFQQSGPEWKKAKGLLDQYAYHCRMLSFELIDPDRFPGKAKRLKCTSYDAAFIESSERAERITATTEEKLTNAILRVLRGSRKTVYFITGHGERSIKDISKAGYSAARDAIEAQNYCAKDLFLMRCTEIPVDAAVVVVAGPTAMIVEKEAEMLHTYMRRGGNVLILVEPETKTGVSSLLKPYGIGVGNDIIVDKLSSIFGTDYLTPIVSEYADHPVMQDFVTASIFPSVRSISAIGKQNQVTEVAFTGAKSWAETDFEKLRQGMASFDPQEDSQGPVPIAVLSEVECGDKDKKGATSRMIVFGDSDFASNGSFNLSGNRYLFMNILSWLAQEEDLIAIRPQSIVFAPVVLSSLEAKGVFWFCVVLLPGAVLLTGVIVLHYRRKAVN